MFTGFYKKEEGSFVILVYRISNINIYENFEHFIIEHVLNSESINIDVNFFTPEGGGENNFNNVEWQLNAFIQRNKNSK